MTEISETSGHYSELARTNSSWTSSRDRENIVSFDKARSPRVDSMRIFTAPTVICQLIVAAYIFTAAFLAGATRRGSATACDRLASVCEELATKGNRRYERRFCADERLSKEVSSLGASSLSLSLFLSSIRPSVCPWPMNADPLMRADLAGLTRPDGCLLESRDFGSGAQRAKSRFKSATRVRYSRRRQRRRRRRGRGTGKEEEKGRGPRYKRSPPYCIGNLTVPI